MIDHFLRSSIPAGVPTKRCAVILFLALWISPALHAHLQPTTLIALDIAQDHVAMSVHIPLSELELAFGHDVSRNPEQRMPEWEAPFRAYLVRHIRPLTPAGKPWTVQVLDMKAERAEQTRSGPFQEVTVQIRLTPPTPADLRDFDLHYDVILHQVVTHKALVSVQNDWAGGQLQPVQVGRIAVDTATTKIEPLAVHLGAGSWQTGFRAMVSLGMQHIREGTDHMLFLLVLLLPATLRANGRRWGAYGGSRYSLTRLVKIVSAFTLGHSVTLLAGALHWLTLPQRPVEVLIACSILVTAIHAIRPIFPGREQQVAAGFGLIHGLAFATVLADLHLSGGPMALSILGFNLGIELMQLFLIAITVPWLTLLSLTPVHRHLRVGGAVLAIIAAAGWIGNRVSGESNWIERGMTAVTPLAPLGVLILAMISIAAYLANTSRPGPAYINERNPQ